MGNTSYMLLHVQNDKELLIQLYWHVVGLKAGVGVGVGVGVGFMIVEEGGGSGLAEEVRIFVEVEDVS